jgi:hypothetical protein
LTTVAAAICGERKVEKKKIGVRVTGSGGLGVLISRD